jgi:DeoR/GlpR family transcriptional regulator of sugar metabolism
MSSTRAELDNHPDEAANMLAQARRMKILELLQEEGSARVSDLSGLFKVSEPTIRQDLDRLQEEGLIVREHGGAYLKSIPQQVGAQTLQHTENMDKKVLIGRKAAEFIEDGDAIVLDSGTTVTEVARNLVHKKNLRVVTNSLNIALLLGTHYEFEIMMTGGDFKAPTLSLTGPRAAAFFSQIHVDKLFLATGGVSLEAGLTFPGFHDLEVKRAMIQAARVVYLVADSTKIGRTAFASLGALDRVHYLITDAGISSGDRSALEERGLKVVIAG